MIQFAVLALCVAAAAASGDYGAQSHINVQRYNPWGDSQYGVDQTHGNLVGGHSDGYGGYGGGYGKYVGGNAKFNVEAKGSGGYGKSGYGDGHDGYGNTGQDGYYYKYSVDAGNGYGYGTGNGYGGYDS